MEAGCLEQELPGAAHALPIGAVVEYQSPDNEFDRAILVVVEHSRDCNATPLYMVAKRPIAPPGKRLAPAFLASQEYLEYRLHAGWFEANVPLTCLRDTGQRVKVRPFDGGPA